jgi:hypothetical protein
MRHAHRPEQRAAFPLGRARADVVSRREAMPVPVRTNIRQGDAAMTRALAALLIVLAAGAAPAGEGAQACPHALIAPEGAATGIPAAPGDPRARPVCLLPVEDEGAAPAPDEFAAGGRARPASAS